MPPDEPNSKDPADLVPAALADTEFEAETKAAILRDEGIDVFVFKGERSWLGASQNALSGERVPVLVRRRDAARARALIEQTVQDSIDIDWDEIDTGDQIEDQRMEGEGRWGRMFFFGVILAIAVLWLALYLTTGRPF